MARAAREITIQVRKLVKIFQEATAADHWLARRIIQQILVRVGRDFTLESSRMAEKPSVRAQS